MHHFFLSTSTTSSITLSKASLCRVAGLSCSKEPAAFAGRNSLFRFDDPLQPHYGVFGKQQRLAKIGPHIVSAQREDAKRGRRQFRIRRSFRPSHQRQLTTGAVWTSLAVNAQSLSWWRLDNRSKLLGIVVMMRQHGSHFMLLSGPEKKHVR